MDTYMKIAVKYITDEKYAKAKEYFSRAKKFLDRLAKNGDLNELVPLVSSENFSTLFEVYFISLYKSECYSELVELKKSEKIDSVLKFFSQI